MLRSVHSFTRQSHTSKSLLTFVKSLAGASRRESRTMNSSVAHHKVSPVGEVRSTSALGGCETYFISSSQGKNLFARCWKPPAHVELRGLVFLCHGYSEHLGWYDPIGTALADKGLVAFGHDHVGHGRSDGLRCFVNDATEYVDDVMIHIAKLKEQHPHLPLYIIGHSMGGMVTISAVLADAEVSGVVLMGPLILPDPKEATPVKMTAARMVAWICPNFPVGRLRKELVTRDKEMLSSLIKDELGYQGAFRAQWACAVVDLLMRNKAALGKFSVPFLILHGEHDGICSLAGSQIMIDEAPVKDKKLKVFPDALHHLYLEKPDTRQEAIADTVDWIVQRLPPSPSHKQ